MEKKKELTRYQYWAILLMIYVFMMFCHTVYNYNERIKLQRSEDYITVMAKRTTQLQYVDENGNKFGGKFFLPVDYFSYNKNDKSNYFDTLYGFKLFLPLVFLVPAYMASYVYKINDDHSVSRQNKE